MAMPLKGKSKSLVLFGEEVRRFRQAKGLSQEGLGAKIPVSGSNIGQIERGDVRCARETAVKLDEILDTRGSLPSLWDKLVKDTAFPVWFDWPEVEAEATHLRTYQVSIMYGLSQIEEYAWVLLKGDPQKVAARMGRQDILFRQEPPAPRLSILLYEGVLHHQIGSAEVMAKQLGRLQELTELPNVSVQVVPSLPSAGTAGSFTLATLPDRSEVGYADMAGRDLTLHEPDDIRALADSYDEIRDEALPVDMSRARIQKIMEERWTT